MPPRSRCSAGTSRADKRSGYLLGRGSARSLQPAPRQHPPIGEHAWSISFGEPALGQRERRFNRTNIQTAARSRQGATQLRCLTAMPYVRPGAEPPPPHTLRPISRDGAPNLAPAVSACPPAACGTSGRNGLRPTSRSPIGTQTKPGWRLQTRGLGKRAMAAPTRKPDQGNEACGDQRRPPR
jgi:hypothetical protein